MSLCFHQTGWLVLQNITGEAKTEITFSNTLAGLFKLETSVFRFSLNSGIFRSSPSSCPSPSGGEGTYAGCFVAYIAAGAVVGLRNETQQSIVGFRCALPDLQLQLPYVIFHRYRYRYRNRNRLFFSRYRLSSEKSYLFLTFFLIHHPKAVDICSLRPIFWSHESFSRIFLEPSE